MDKAESDILNEYKQRRIEEIRKAQSTLKEIKDETLLLKKTKKDTLLVHFYDKRFPRCVELTKALEYLAPKFPSIEFLNAEAILFPFVTDKLQIIQLPYLASFTKGFFIGGIIGFQDIGDDHLNIDLLEQYILQSDLSEKVSGTETNEHEEMNKSSKSK